MKRYRMIGTQQIKLPDGRCVDPGCGEFRADLGAQEDFLLRVGAIEEVVQAAEPEPEVKKRGHHGD